jgi:hypothetical protein
VSQGTLYQALRRITPLRAVVRRARECLARWRIDVWIVSGNERRSGEPLVALCAGQLETKNYLVELLFAQSCSEIHRRGWIWSIFRYAVDRSRGHAIAFVDTDRVPRRSSEFGRGVFWLRGWVRTELDLARAEERIRRSDGIKSDTRKISEHGLYSETTTDARAFERFYWDMYQPYARQGFGGKAIYMNYEQMQAGFRNPELLQVKKRDQTVAAMIVLYPEHGLPHWWVLGMRDGDRGLIKQGALAAIYLFGVERLRERGYKRVLLGGVRPFLADGVLQYKRKWGARLIAGDDGDPHWLMVSVAHPTRAVHEFLKACPLVSEDDHGLVGHLFADGIAPDEDKRVARQRAEFAAMGIDRAVTIELAVDDGIDRPSGRVLAQGRAQASI